MLSFCFYKKYYKNIYYKQSKNINKLKILNKYFLFLFNYIFFFKNINSMYIYILYFLKKNNIIFKFVSFNKIVFNFLILYKIIYLIIF